MIEWYKDFRFGKPRWLLVPLEWLVIPFSVFWIILHSYFPIVIFFNELRGKETTITLDYEGVIVITEKKWYWSTPVRFEVDYIYDPEYGDYVWAKREIDREWNPTSEWIIEAGFKYKGMPIIFSDYAGYFGYGEPDR